ncbi:MAG: peptidylprolyl isomerase [Chitinophagaceae bacterium]|nr:peptidylprolyl isomerase [Chitinophagaceae bacterium]
MKNLLFVFLVVLFSCSIKKYDNPHIIIYTDYGKIEAELYPKQAPKTVAAFLSYIDRGLYNNGSFYRVMKDETLSEEYNSGFIQGGIIKTNPGVQQTIPGIEMESPKTNKPFQYKRRFIFCPG